MNIEVIESKEDLLAYKNKWGYRIKSIKAKVNMLLAIIDEKEKGEMGCKTIVELANILKRSEKYDRIKVDRRTLGKWIRSYNLLREEYIKELRGGNKASTRPFFKLIIRNNKNNPKKNNVIPEKIRNEIRKIQMDESSREMTAKKLIKCIKGEYKYHTIYKHFKNLDREFQHKQKIDKRIKKDKIRQAKKASEQNLLSFDAQIYNDDSIIIKIDE